MRPLALLLTLLGSLMLLLGPVFLIASSEGNASGRLPVGIVLLVAGVVLLRTSLGLDRRRREDEGDGHRGHIAGDVEMRELRCRSCGGLVTAEDLSVVEGALVVTCPFCGAVHHLREEPRW